MISYLCELVGVSRSGYYNYFSLKSRQNREKQDINDELVRNIILKAYRFKGYQKGARQIKMTLNNRFKIVYNLKRIRRIMKKYNIICKKRKPNPYKRMMKATKEHSVFPNILKRNFKQNMPGKSLLTDITYLFYGTGKRAYLSTIKDSSTNEILAYNISESLTIDIALDTLHKLRRNKKVKISSDAYIHSDQGFHYTNPTYQKLVGAVENGQ